MGLNVYALCPVKLPERAKAVAQKWKDMGYRMVFFQDYGTKPFTEELTICGAYNGYWRAMNSLADKLVAQTAITHRPDAVVFMGDDMEPDPTKTAEAICREYLKRFPTGLGVMQPCGDQQGMDVDPNHPELGRIPAAARICGSAWFGREWIQRSYNGRGPTDDRYYHFYADESLKQVAEKLGVLWMRDDLTQMHKHWSWGHTERQDYHKQTSSTWWEIDKAIYMASKAAGFPEGRLLDEN